MEDFKYLGTNLTYQNSIQEEIKCRLKSGNACYHSVKNLLSSRLLSKNLKIKIYSTILPVVLYGCETWSLTLREERRLRLRVFENRVLRRIFGPKRDEVIREWRNLHNEELYDLYSSPNIVRVMKSRRMGWAGHVARMGERRGVYRVLVGKPEGKRPLGRPRRRWYCTWSGTKCYLINLRMLIKFIYSHLPQARSFGVLTPVVAKDFFFQTLPGRTYDRLCLF